MRTFIISQFHIFFFFQGCPLLSSIGFGALAQPDLNKQKKDILIYTYLIISIGIIGGILQMISSYTLTKAAAELTMRMRIISFKSILRQDIRWFDLDENNLGILVTRLSTDATLLKSLTDPTIGFILNALGALTFSLFISFTSGWKLTLIILSLTSLTVIIVVIIQNQRETGKKKRSTSNAEEGGRVYLIE